MRQYLNSNEIRFCKSFNHVHVPNRLITCLLAISACIPIDVINVLAHSYLTSGDDYYLCSIKDTLFGITCVKGSTFPYLSFGYRLEMQDHDGLLMEDVHAFVSDKRFGKDLMVVSLENAKRIMRDRLRSLELLDRLPTMIELLVNRDYPLTGDWSFENNMPITENASAKYGIQN